MKKKKKKVTFRLNALFFVVFLLFSALILKLGVVQIVYGEAYQKQVQSTNEVTVNNPVPRGKIYDRYGRVIVDNTPLDAITYTKSSNADPTQMLQVAENLSKLIHMDTSTIQERDKKDFWILKNPQKANALITQKEWASYNQSKLTDSQIYQMQLDRITNQDIQFSPSDLNVLAIYRQFNSGYALTPQIVKNQNVTPTEYAVVSENLTKLPGVDTTTDWDRKYVYGNTLQTVLGTVSSSQQGLPSDQLDQYLAMGYSRNDRVGTSYIEQQYENVLQGQKAKVVNVTDQSGNIVSTQTVSPGQRGDDLVLTIDMNLQQQVEKIIEDELTQDKQLSNTSLLDRAFVVMMNPYTGDILTMAGKQIQINNQGRPILNAQGKPTFSDFALGTYTTSYNVGSAVKGATVLTGYKTGAIQPGSTWTDEPLQIPYTPLIKSWKTFGNINDLEALEVSSNVYMWKTVIAMAGGHYVPNQPLDLNYNTYNTIRNSFAQFGLGTLTGIDLPNETAGYKGPSEPTPGLLMYMGIGQYDTYTTMQLAQYVSTIANGGYRIQPHIVKEIREPSNNSNQLGPIIKEVQPTVLNKINFQDSWIKRVQQGFRLVMSGPIGTMTPYFQGVTYDPAGKSGTAQAFYDGPLRKEFKAPPETMNLSMVAYAPYNNPQVAIAVLVPWAYQTSTGPGISEILGRKVLDAYFALQKQEGKTNASQHGALQTGN